MKAKIQMGEYTYTGRVVMFDTDGYGSCCQTVFTFDSFQGAWGTISLGDFASEEAVRTALTSHRITVEE